MRDLVLSAVIARCTEAEADALLWRKRAEEYGRQLAAVQRASIRKIDRPVHWLSPAGTIGFSPETRKVIDNGRIGELRIAGSMLDEERAMFRCPEQAVQEHTDQTRHQLLREIEKLIVVKTNHDDRERCTVTQMSLIVGVIDP